MGMGVVVVYVLDEVMVLWRGGGGCGGIDGGRGTGGGSRLDGWISGGGGGGPKRVNAWMVWVKFGKY